MHMDNHEFNKKEKLPLKFYINVGAIEPKVSMKDTNKAFKDNLINHGYKVNLRNLAVDMIIFTGEKLLQMD